jgi:hypothetical protein
MRPTHRGRNDDFTSTCGTMLITILTGMIDIELVMSVLNGRDTQTPTGQFPYNINDQRRFTGILVSGNTKNFHAIA